MLGDISVVIVVIATCQCVWAADVYNEDLDTQRAASTVMTHGSTCSGPGMANLVYSLGPEGQLLCSTLHAMRAPKDPIEQFPDPGHTVNHSTI